jgi:3-hydroxy-3-methylglutaryl CoA synthase/uncharacterized OB-fold protein
MSGITSYGAYIPHFRLDRASIAAALGGRADTGSRAIASYDEDATSMGVAAARHALKAADDRRLVRQLYFATAAPPYLDKTNAAAIHAALRLDASVLAVDMIGSVRSGVGALVCAAASRDSVLSVLADVRVGLPGSDDERNGGDAAAAFVFAGDANTSVIAEVIGHHSTTAEVLDRWREPSLSTSRVWEERFGESVLVPVALDTWRRALDSAGIEASQIDHLIVSGLSARCISAIERQSGCRPAASRDSHVTSIGNSGVAQPGISLADALDRANPGENVALIVVGDGASVIMLRTTEALVGRRQPVSVATQVSCGYRSIGYPTYLQWRGLLDRDPPRRPIPVPPAAPPSQRRVTWKFGFVGSECEACNSRYLPPVRVCAQCGVADRMLPRSFADARATVATFTVDRLTYSPSPPVIAAVIDFDGGGRFKCELTDLAPDSIVVGARVEMTFRRLGTVSGVHNYFWKARPLTTEG